MIRSLLSLLFLLAFKLSFGQTMYQYFDGQSFNALVVNIDSTPNNIWQIGQPQKTFFNSALSQPRALVTDTINAYPVNDTSGFWIEIIPYQMGFAGGIRALQWAQKLDYTSNLDGGTIEFSSDDGATWSNVFNNPYVYSFYGFDSQNADTLADGTFAFSGRDTSWKDIWLCFDFSFYNDTVMVRFKNHSDGNDDGKEGWMIDNMIAHLTIVHTAKRTEPTSEDLKVYPSVSSSRFNIEGKPANDHDVIQSLKVYDAAGRLVKDYGRCPLKFYIDLGSYAEGKYMIDVQTTVKKQTFPVMVKK
jgi:hypothetical protein